MFGIAVQVGLYDCPTFLVEYNMVKIRSLYIYIYSLSLPNLPPCPPCCMAQIEWISTRGRSDVISAMRFQGSGSTRSAPWSSPNMILKQDSVYL